ncbi:hypothetical protein A8O14_06035 [Polynucleobacter wuianus]|uniref:VanZ-like domain-containing protein n=2 Tax=Polynucleobacter wuianus TaxID=1743168 RepID=A0A191UFF8_9BURK|nr:MULTISPECIES: VanZ family protein [Polynucleobacter]ANI99677.1 hypothetical protein A8O14_06035 [Polynucleobacter wuianus]
MRLNWRRYLARIEVKMIFFSLIFIFTILFLVPLYLLPPDDIFHWWDKAQHMLIFFILSFLGVIAYPRIPKTIFFALAAFGGLIEIIQSFTGWRTGELIDWYADLVGILAMWLTIRSFMFIREQT